MRALHLDTQEVAQANLSDVVADVLVVLKVNAWYSSLARKGLGCLRLREVSILMLPKVTILIFYHACAAERGVNASSVFPCLWRHSSLSHCRQGTHFFGSFSCLVTGTSESLHWFAEFSFTEKEEGMPVTIVRTTITSTFAAHVGQIDTFAEHVTVDRCFWRSNA